MALLGSLVLGSPGGPSLFSIVAPTPDEIVRFAGLRVMVRLPEDGRVRPGSLRVRLNGADVTSDLETASNGAFGELHGLLDGENLLEVEAEGPSWWLDGRPFADRAALSVRVRRPTDLDRG